MDIQSFSDWGAAEEHAKRLLDAGSVISLSAWREVNEDGYVDYAIVVSDQGKGNEQRPVGTYTLEDE